MASSLFIHSSKKRPWEDSYYCCRVGHSCSHDTDFMHEEDQAQARPAILKEHFLQLRESCSSINSPRRCQWTYLPFLPHGHILFKRKNCNKVKNFGKIFEINLIYHPQKSLELQNPWWLLLLLYRKADTEDPNRLVFWATCGAHCISLGSIVLFYCII